MSYLFMLSGRNSVLSSTIDPPIELPDNQAFVVGFLNFISYNNIPNVDATNNVFQHGKHIIKIPTGTYEIKDIEDYLKSVLLKEERNFILKANLNTLRSELKHSFPIDFRVPNSIGPLLGFKPQLLQPPQSRHISDYPINITKVNTICIDCNIVSNSFNNGKPVHIIHSFTTKVEPGYKIDESPTNTVYLPINTRYINEIVLKIVDQDGNLVNFNGELITVTLHLKSIIGNGI